jgi:hypothetical protein
MLVLEVRRLHLPWRRTWEEEEDAQQQPAMAATLPALSLSVPLAAPQLNLQRAMTVCTGAASITQIKNKTRRKRVT